MERPKTLPDGASYGRIPVAENIDGKYMRSVLSTLLCLFSIFLQRRTDPPRLSSHSRQMPPRHHRKAGRSRSGEKLRKIFATHNESEGGDITIEDAPPLADTVTVRSSLSHA